MPFFLLIQSHQFGQVVIYLFLSFVWLCGHLLQIYATHLLSFVERIRDESHRFAISAHRARRKKGISKSLLDQIEGIGSIRKRALLNHFGSARAVESASLDEIKSVEGVEEKVAKKIYNFFHE